MGGTKKPTISKLKKLASRRDEKKKEEKKREAYRSYISEKERQDIINFVKKQKYVTPYMVSRRAEVKLSLARDLLRSLAKEGILKLEEKNRELEIYVPISS